MGVTAVIPAQIVGVAARSLLVNNTSAEAACQTVSFATAPTGHVLTVQSDGSVAFAAVSAGIGGSTGSTDNAVLRSDGTGGATLQNTGVTIDDSNNILTSGYIRVGTSTADVRLTQNGISNNASGTYSIISWTGGTVIDAISIVGYVYQGIRLERLGGIQTWCCLNFSVAVTGGNGGQPRTPLDVRGTASIAGDIIQHNGATAVKHDVYNTYTSNTSFERLGISWSGNVCTITTEKGSAGGTLRGLKIGDAATALLGFYGATAIVQPGTGVASATRIGGGGTALTDTDTFDGYTIGQIVKALRNLGFLA
jgi:hypothetical protein